MNYLRYLSFVLLLPVSLYSMNFPDINTLDETYDLAKSRGRIKRIVSKKNRQKRIGMAHQELNSDHKKYHKKYKKKKRDLIDTSLLIPESYDEDDDTASTSSELSVCDNDAFQSCEHPYCLLKRKYHTPDNDDLYNEDGILSSHNHTPYRHIDAYGEQDLIDCLSTHSDRFYEVIDSSEIFIAASISSRFDQFLDIFNTLLQSNNNDEQFARSFLRAFIHKLLTVNMPDVSAADLQSLAAHVNQSGEYTTTSYHAFNHLLHAMNTELDNFIKMERKLYGFNYRISPCSDPDDSLEESTDSDECDDNPEIDEADEQDDDSSSF